MSLFFELHSGLPREGPGDDASTRRAIRIVEPYLPERPAVLDIGCGPGSQTLVISDTLPGCSITAIDLHYPFLEELARRAKAAGMSDRIAPQAGDMRRMDFATSSFDLIWSEGAIWITGFVNGLNEWKRLLKAGGCMVVSELTWVTDKPHPEEYEFWTAAYPGIVHDGENRAAIVASGLELLSAFRLPRESWFSEYLRPLDERAQKLLEVYRQNPEAIAWIMQERREIEIARRYSGFAYMFYVMRKRVV